MVRVPLPAVIDPLVIDQLYVAPAPASATLAELPVDRAHVALAAVIVATGMALKTTVVDAEPLWAQAPLVLTVTV